MAIMAMTVRRLARESGLGLSLVTGTANADRTVAWAHATELADPTPYLTGGGLVMTTGMGIGKSKRTQFEYVERLADSGISALAFDTGTTFTTVPEGVLAAGTKLSFPILAVPRTTPFIAITRAVTDEVTADQLRAVQRVVDEQAVMARSTLQEGILGVVNTLCTSLGATTVVLSADGTTLSADGPDADRIAALGSTLIGTKELSPRRAARVVSDGAGYCTIQGLRATQALRGYLMVRSAEPLSTSDRLLVSHAVSLIAIELEKPGKVLDAEHRLRSAATLALLTKSYTADSGVLRYFGFAPEDQVIVLVLTHTGPTLNAETLVRQFIDAHRSSYLLHSRSEHIVVVLPADSTIADELRDHTSTALRRRIGAGLSAPCVIGELDSALRQAQIAARGSERHGRVRAFADIGVFDIILGSRNADELELIGQRLHALRRYDALHPSGPVSLVATLEAFLEHNGHSEAAAASIGIHRHTMRNRMAKISELARCDLDDADARAELWLAIRAGQRLSTRRDARPDT